MAYEIYEVSDRGTRAKIDGAATFEAAKATVRARFTILALDDDADHPGCADFFTFDGRVGCIQPIGFTI